MDLDLASRSIGIGILTTWPLGHDYLFLNSFRDHDLSIVFVGVFVVAG